MVNATVCKTVPMWFTGSIPVTPIESSAIHSSNKKHACISSALAGLFILAKEVT